MSLLLLFYRIGVTNDATANDDSFFLSRHQNRQSL